MRNRWFGAAAALILIFGAFAGAPAVAQEQVGSIVGTVKSDETPMPGVTVEVKGSSGTLTGVTNVNGDFRFPRVLPGTYTVTAKISGFKTYENRNVAVSLGERITVNIPLVMSTVMETIVVSGEAVQISMGDNSTSAKIGGETLNRLPKGRDFTSVVAMAPGASNEPFLAGISIDGASGSENRFVIDGIDTTHPGSGQSGQNFITDMVEEVQVKSAGYAAEYGGGLGGVINAITKSGSNEFRGQVGVYYGNNSMDGNVNGENRRYYQESYPGYYRTFEKDKESRWEPGFGLGGPIVRDALWFFAGYWPTLISTERTPVGSATTYKQDQTRNYFSGNLKGNVGSQFVYKLSANLSPRKTEGVLPAYDGSTPTSANLNVNTKDPTASYSAYMDWVPGSTFFLSGRGGYYDTNTETEGVKTDPQFYFRNGIIPVPVSDPRYAPTPFFSVPVDSFYETGMDKWKRYYGGLDANLFVNNLLGSHAFKVGVLYEKIKNDVVYGEAGNQFENRWGLADRYSLGVQGTYGSVAVRRFRTEGGATDTNMGIYIQDTWTIHRDVTLNIGLRTEQERVPNYGAARDPSLPKNAIEFNFKDKLAPRLGFAWDIGGKQKVKLYGSYGNYYDIMKVEMARGSFGADQWVTHVYPLNTLDWSTLNNGCTLSQNTLTDNPCPALGVPRSRDLRAPTDPADSIDPNLKPMENREIQAGVDWQVTKNSVLGVRYVNKKLLNTIEDVGVLVFFPDGSSEEQYFTANPGKGITLQPGANGCTPEENCPPHGVAVRNYEAFEVNYSRRFANNFSLHASYTYSKLKGNYGGLASSDEFGRTDPNVARYFDGVAYSYDESGNFVEGPLNTDRPHTVQVQGYYRAPFNTSIGINASWRSGTPVTTNADWLGVYFYPYGRNDQGRLASLTNFDVMLAQPFQIGKVNLEVSVNVLNILDAHKITRVGVFPYQDDICDVAPGCDSTNNYYFNTLVPYNFDALMRANGGTPNPAYMNAYTASTDATRQGYVPAYQSPRTVRFALKLFF